MRTKKTVTEVRLENGTIADLTATATGINIVTYSGSIFYFDATITKRDARELAAALLELAND